VLGAGWRTLSLNTDYVLLLRAQKQNGVEQNSVPADGRGGHNTERIMLTVRGFRLDADYVLLQRALEQNSVPADGRVVEYIRRKCAAANAAVEEQKAIAEAATAAAEGHKAKAAALEAKDRAREKKLSRGPSTGRTGSTRRSRRSRARSTTASRGRPRTRSTRRSRR
jgi:hypothetical protein